MKITENKISLIFLALAVVVLSGCIDQPTEGLVTANFQANPNLVQNPGFEQDTAVNCNEETALQVVPTGWAKWRGNAERALQTCVGFAHAEGTKSFRADYDPNWDLYHKTFVLKQDMPVQAGKTYTLSGWTRSVDVISGSCWIDLYKLRVPLTYSPAVAIISGTTGWTYGTIDYTVPDGLTDMELRLVGAQSGSCWFDGISLVEKPESTTPTPPVFSNINDFTFNENQSAPGDLFRIGDVVGDADTPDGELSVELSGTDQSLITCSIAQYPPEKSRYVNCSAPMANSTGTNTLTLFAEDPEGNSDTVAFDVVVQSDSNSPAPTNLTATAESSTTINLEWDAIAGGADSYKIYRSSSATGTYLQSGTSNTTEFPDVGLQPATTHYYKVSAVKRFQESEKSEYASATTLAAPASNLLQNSGFETGSFSPWSTPSTGDGASTVVSGNAKSGTKYASIIGGDEDSERITQTIANLTAGTVYEVKGWAKDVEVVGGGEEAACYITVTSGGNTVLNERESAPAAWTEFNAGTFTIPTGQTTAQLRIEAPSFGECGVDDLSLTEVSSPTPTTPTAPTNLTATAVSYTRIDLEWDEVPGADGYKIYRLDNATLAYWQIGATTGLTEFSNYGLQPGTTYYYRVSAEINQQESGKSEDAAAATLAVPASTETYEVFNSEGPSSLEGDATFNVIAACNIEDAISTCDCEKVGGGIFSSGTLTETLQGNYCICGYTASSGGCREFVGGLLFGCPRIDAVATCAQ